MSPEASLPKGALVLITGVNGFIAAHIAHQFLQRGYKVRGTVRSLSKSKWLIEDLFRAEASDGSLEVVEVGDMAAEGAFRDAIRGVAAVAHVATINTWDPNPNNVVPQTVAGVESVLKAAAKEPSVKSFVYTSTFGTAIMPLPHVKDHVDQNTWNELGITLGWAPPPYTADRAVVSYIASKVEAEKALWKFVDENKPGFTTNAVLPTTVFGPLLHSNQNPSTDAWVFSLYNGVTEPLVLKAGFFVDVRDVALLHVAAVLDDTVKNERLYAWSDQFIWNDLLRIFRKLQPERKFIDDLPEEERMQATVDDGVSRTLLKKWNNQDDWIRLQQGVKDTVSGKVPKS